MRIHFHGIISREVWDRVMRDIKGIGLLSISTGRAEDQRLPFVPHQHERHSCRAQLRSSAESNHRAELKAITDSSRARALTYDLHQLAPRGHPKAF